MKKLLLFTIVAAFALSLSGCKKSVPTEREWESIQTSRFEDALNDLPDEIPLPDGTTASKSELVMFKGENGEPIGEPAFEFAFIRYAKPIFEVKQNYPGEVARAEDPSDVQLDIQPSDWIKVKAGDVLENGLKVVSAQTSCDYFKGESGTVINLSYGKIKLEGEITYEGIFKYFNGSEAYGGGDYFLDFYPDSTKYKIPVIYSGPEYFKVQTAYLGVNHDLEYDGGEFHYFRFESEQNRSGDDLKDRFREDAVGKATMTFRNVTVRGNNLDGEIVLIDNV